MRGNVVFRVYGSHTDREKDSYFGAFATKREAEAQIADLVKREMHGENWAQKYHDKGFVIREVLVDVEFEVPSQPKPRDKWAVRTTTVSNGPHAWASTEVEVCRRMPEGLVTAAKYLRDYAMLGTFEPFRQGKREYALVSRNYVSTAVIDLSTGEVVAEEPVVSHGFCPVGFYVPDWWDIHDGSIIPGSEYWNSDKEWPNGNLGFVWGCIWGDDSSWKLQRLDLSRVADGIIGRDDAFGYIELVDHGWAPPWLDVDRAHDAKRSLPPSFLNVFISEGAIQVDVTTRVRFDLKGGERLTIDQ
jgi:hypothetical protein